MRKHILSALLAAFIATGAATAAEAYDHGGYAHGWHHSGYGHGYWRGGHFYPVVGGVYYPYGYPYGYTPYPTPYPVLAPAPYVAAPAGISVGFGIR